MLLKEPPPLPSTDRMNVGYCLVVLGLHKAENEGGIDKMWDLALTCLTRHVQTGDIFYWISGCYLVDS